MRVADVLNSIREIAEIALTGDHELARIKETELLRNVLEMVGSSDDVPPAVRQVVNTTLSVRNLDHPRW